jgi:hypothetical protein
MKEQVSKAFQSDNKHSVIPRVAWKPYLKSGKYRLLHGIFHIIPFIIPRLRYKKWQFMICLSYNSTEFSWKLTKWHVINLQTLTERHVMTFRKQLINLLYQHAWAILVKLGKKNTIPHNILSKTQSLSQSKILAILSTSI